MIKFETNIAGHVQTFKAILFNRIFQIFKSLDRLNVALANFNKSFSIYSIDRGIISRLCRTTPRLFG